MRSFGASHYWGTRQYAPRNVGVLTCTVNWRWRYAIGLIVILLALARGNPELGASVLVLAGTMGDIRVSRKGTSRISTKPSALRRTLRRVGGQIIVLAFVLLDIGGLGLTLVASVWLAPWLTINLAALALGTLSWSEDRRVQRESATATQRASQKDPRGAAAEPRRTPSVRRSDNSKPNVYAKRNS